MDLSWSSAVGEYFTVEYKADLASDFQIVRSNILASPNVTTFTTPAMNRGGFYRLKF
jgi:hypothetical protein